ncbi:MAG: hypothetical protein HQK51_00905 [Oligoflexia bacterium]|nr:hypothetical protein [Oligoflexia bacterium]
MKYILSGLSIFVLSFISYGVYRECKFFYNDFNLQKELEKDPNAGSSLANSLSKVTEYNNNEKITKVENQNKNVDTKNYISIKKKVDQMPLSQIHKKIKENIFKYPEGEQLFYLYHIFNDNIVHKNNTSPSDLQNVIESSYISKTLSKIKSNPDAYSAIQYLRSQLNDDDTNPEMEMLLYSLAAKTSKANPDPQVERDFELKVLLSPMVLNENFPQKIHMIISSHQELLSMSKTAEEAMEITLKGMSAQKDPQIINALATQFYKKFPEKRIEFEKKINDNNLDPSSETYDDQYDDNNNEQIENQNPTNNEIQTS